MDPSRRDPRGDPRPARPPSLTPFVDGADRRLFLDAIFPLARGQIAWRVALPVDFPPHETGYALIRWRTRARAWCAPVIDSQTVRAAGSGYGGGCYWPSWP